MTRTSLATLRADLGVGEELIAGFRASHTTPPNGVPPGVPFPLDLALDVVAMFSPSQRSWTRIEGVPKGRITVGVTEHHVVIGRRGHVHLRRDLAGAFGDASGPLGDAWVEVCGSRLGVVGADGDEARRLQRLRAAR